MSCNKKHKAFLGAVIGAASSIAGGLIGRSAQRRAMRRQKIAQNRADTYQMAGALTNAYADQEYADDFLDKVEFKNGGKVRRYNDRVKLAKRTKATGRKRSNNEHYADRI